MKALEKQWLIMLKRTLDCCLVVLSFPALLPLFLITFLIVRLTSAGPAFYWSKRVGRNNILFDMPKFRSMKVETPALATHLLNQRANPTSYLTPVGSFIRKTSLDELPQLWSVLKGEMSIVGPRPALYNQDDLITLRTECGVHVLKPGITGWAQVNGRDEIPISQKVVLDTFYLEHKSLWLDIKIIMLTVLKVIRRDNISH